MIFGMPIETVADWATFLAFAFAVVGGPIWWCWTRHKRRQRVKAIQEEMLRARKGLEQAIDSYLELLKVTGISEITMIEAKVSIATLYLSLLRDCLYADLALTHGEESLMPDWKLQWPIASRDSP